MAYFAMSDIHGYYDEFIQMYNRILQLDGFGYNLVLCGNYIDIGPKSYEMVNWIIKAFARKDPILAIKGNHEYEFVQYIDLLLKNNIYPNLYFSCVKLHEKNNLFDRYGTIRKLIKEYNFTINNLIEWRDLFDQMPYYYRTLISGKRCIFCHAGFRSRSDMKGQTLDNYYHYLLYNTQLSLRRPYRLIYGHSPTTDITSVFYNNGNIYTYSDDENYMWADNINCGIIHKDVDPHAKLACLCIDVNREFYIR